MTRLHVVKTCPRIWDHAGNRLFDLAIGPPPTEPPSPNPSYANGCRARVPCPELLLDVVVGPIPLKFRPFCTGRHLTGSRASRFTAIYSVTDFPSTAYGLHFPLAMYMENSQEITIARKASDCLDVFKRLLPTQEGNGHQPLANDLPEDAIIDALARFRTWIENLGALQRGESSLDYRLRHADIRVEVLRLLCQLLLNLNDC